MKTLLNGNLILLYFTSFTCGFTNIRTRIVTALLGIEIESKNNRGDIVL